MFFQVELISIKLKAIRRRIWFRMLDRAEAYYSSDSAMGKLIRQLL